MTERWIAMRFTAEELARARARVIAGDYGPALKPPKLIIPMRKSGKHERRKSAIEAQAEATRDAIERALELATEMEK